MSTITQTFRYKLEHGSKKHRCPGCNKKRFVRYVDQQTDDYLSEKYGRCDREVKCGYFMNPYDDGYAQENGSDWQQNDYQAPQPEPTDYVPYKLLSASQKAYKQNNFVTYLRNLFDDATARDLIKKYHIGSSKHWKGSTVFWQIDIEGNIHSGKVMLYQVDGHRKKTNGYSYINWVHTILYGRGDENEFNLEQCLFGEHLLTGDKSKPVAIVESEKTAIISSVYFPEFIWLAAGALNNLKPKRCKVLIGRRVVLYPDIGAFEKWQDKAEHLDYFCDVSVSDLLENNADAKAIKQGYDLADYLIQYRVDDFLSNTVKANHLPKKDTPANDKYEAESNGKFNHSAPYGKNPYTGEVFDRCGYPKDWDTFQMDPLKELKKRDSTFKTLVNKFNAEPIDEVTHN